MSFALSVEDQAWQGEVRVWEICMKFDGFNAILLGAALGIMSLTILDKTFNGFANQARTAIAECEKNLPRDVRCKVIAIPK